MVKRWEIVEEIVIVGREILLKDVKMIEKRSILEGLRGLLLGFFKMERVLFMVELEHAVIN